MITVGRRIIALGCTVLAAGFVALVSGCDWLSSSENVQRASPYISDLVISPAFAQCPTNNGFTVQFNYEDLQGDLSEARVLLTHTDNNTDPPTVTERPELILWPEDLSTSIGTIVIPLSFRCKGVDEDPEGEWSIQVTAVDRRDHLSNVLQGTITLL